MSSKAPDAVATYKQNMIIYLSEHHILDRINEINDKLKHNHLNSRDLKEINKIDEIITTGMIQSEERIKKSKFTHPWSPILAIAIFTATIWKLRLNAITNKRNNHHIVLKILKKITDIDDTNIILNIASTDKQYIKNELKLASKTLKQIKKILL